MLSRRPALSTSNSSEPTVSIPRTSTAPRTIFFLYRSSDMEILCAERHRIRPVISLPPNAKQTISLNTLLAGPLKMPHVSARPT